MERHRYNAMAMGRPTPMLWKRDAVTGNLTVAPSPEPSPTTPEPEPTALGPHSNGPSHQGGPPYGPSLALVGGIPSTGLDIPVSGVLLAFFATAAAANMTILQLNKRAGLKFLFSGMMFALCFLRSIALTVRIVWACYPKVANVAMAAGILTQTGSVLVFIINLIIAQRIMRAYHSSFGWHPITTFTFRFLIGCVVACLVMAITVTIQSFFTLDEKIRHSDHLVQLFTGSYMAVLAFLPIPVIAISAAWPRTYHLEKFGAGRWRSKVRLVLFTSSLATVGATFRVFTSFATKPVNEPAWYHSRECYYCFNFVIDLIIAAAYLLTRFDRRFIVPNGAKGPGDYATGMRVRPSSVTTSSSDHNEKEGGEGEEDGGKKQHNSMDKGKGNDKGKSKNLESDDKGPTNDSVPQLSLSEIHTYGTGDWNGVPWPFRTSWAMTSRNFGGPRPSSGNPNISNTEDDKLESPIDDGKTPHDIKTVDEDSSEGSSRWGGETSSSTCIQEPDAVHFPTRRNFQPHQLEPGGQSHEWGQALTSDEEVQLAAPRLTPDTVIWPFASETHADPVVNNSLSRNNSTAAQSTAVASIAGPSRHNSTIAPSIASSSRTPSRGRSTRSRNQTTDEESNEKVPNIEGGWI